MQNYLGSGQFGQVYRAQNQISNENYAAKVFVNEIDKDTLDEELNDLSREVIILSQLDHPSILKYKGYSPIDFEKEQRPVIFTGYVPKGTLNDLINQERANPNNAITDTQKLIIIYGIASAISYLHKHNILHRDLKPSNILIDEFFFPKIADFGLSKDLNHPFPKKDDQCKGTPIYMAPEIHKDCSYSKASDVYAFSMIVYELITNQIPFEKVNYFALMGKLVKKERPEFKTPISNSYKQLIESCWNEEPSKRPTFDEIIEILKNDRGFITEKVNEKEYKIYIDFIEKYNNNFIQSNNEDFINVLKRFSKSKIINNDDEIIDYYSIDIKIYPLEEFDELNDKCKKIIVEASNDPSLQFLVGKYIIEGQQLFPQNYSIGVKCLLNSIKIGIIEAAIYYCKILIKNNDINKAKEIADKYIKDKYLSQYFYLYGKICKKENKYTESLEFYKQSISLDNNSDSMYEYGRILFKKLNKKEEGIQYYIKAIENDCVEAMYQYGNLLFKGEQIQKNEIEGEKYIKLAAEKDHPKALFLYSQLIITKNKANITDEIQLQSLNYLKRSAYKGNLDAMSLYTHFLYFSRIYIFDDRDLITLLKNLSEKGHLFSMLAYGLMLANGEIEPNPIKAAKYLKIVANHGYELAIHEYAFRSFRGDGLPLNKEEGIKYLKILADKGNLKAMVKYALICKKGDGILADDEEAEKYFQMAIEKEDRDAMLYYFVYTAFENKKSDLSKAIKYCKILIEKGDIDAINNYISMLLKYKNIPNYKEEIIKYSKIAIEKGSSVAMNNYAAFLLENQDLCKNEDPSKYFKMAIYNGLSGSISNYAYALYSGIGMPANKEEAVKYFKMGIEKGDINSICNYAVKLFHDYTVPNHFEKALKYFKMAVDKGDYYAMIYYGFMLYFGCGTIANKVKALEYFQYVINNSEIKGIFINPKKYIVATYNIEGYKKNLISSISKGYINSIIDYAVLIEDQKESIQYFKLAADKGDSDAMTIYAMILFYYGKTLIDKEESIKYLKLAILMDNSIAMNVYGLILNEGDEFPVDKEITIDYYKKFASNENSNEMFNIPAMLFDGKGIPLDKKEIAFCKKDQVDTENLYTRSIMIDLPDNKEYKSNSISILDFVSNLNLNKEEAIEYFKLSADRGNSDAMFNYATMLFNGYGTSINKEESAKYYKMSADKGNTYAMFNYATMLFNGYGIPINKEEAVKYFKLSADRNNSKAMFIYGEILYQGDIVPINKEEAAKYFKKSADNRNSDAMLTYANMLQFGDGIPINKEEASKYYHEAMANYNMDAFLTYANILYNNEDEDQKKKEDAIKNYKLAYKFGCKDAKYALQNILGIDSFKIFEEEYAYSYMHKAIVSGMINLFKSFKIKEIEKLKRNLLSFNYFKENYNRIDEIKNEICNSFIQEFDSFKFDIVDYVFELAKVSGFVDADLLYQILPKIKKEINIVDLINFICISEKLINEIANEFENVKKIISKIILEQLNCS